MNTKEKKLRPNNPFVIDLTKNIIYCSVCGKQETLPDDYNHSLKPKNYWDKFRKSHDKCFKKYKNE